MLHMSLWAVVVSLNIMGSLNAKHNLCFHFTVLLILPPVYDILNRFSILAVCVPGNLQHSNVQKHRNVIMA